MGRGGSACVEQKYRDERRENGEGETAKLSGGQGRSPELLTVIHNPPQALFFGFLRVFHGSFSVISTEVEKSLTVLPTAGRRYPSGAGLLRLITQPVSG
jgi:hypothetical protein